jgi:hypothetical protein
LLALLDHQDTREQTRPPQTSTQIA